MMKTPRSARRTRFATLTLLAGLLGTTGMAHAGPHGAQGMFGDKFAEKLDLNAQQQTLFDASREEMASGRKDGKALREQLKALVLADVYDEAAVAKTAGQLAEHLRAQLVEQSKQFNALYRSLDEEQRATLASMDQQRKERKKRRWHQQR